MANSVTLEIRGRTTPERLLATIREQSPGLLVEAPPPVPPQEDEPPLVPEALLTPGEVAVMFRVDPKTVTKWAKRGRLPSFRTPGGHRRFREAEVRALIDASDTGRDEG
jgi:excisionase family DNA binding protein